MQNYITLEKTRKGNDVDIKFNIAPISSDLFIAPLLFTPFVENTFKYVSNYNENFNNIIRIDIKIDESIVELLVFNTFDSGSSFKKSKKSGGLGIENAKRRLELIYNDKFDLIINKTETDFEVALKIDLSS